MQDTQFGPIAGPFVARRRSHPGRWLALAAVASICLLASTCAHAQFINVADLLQDLESDDSAHVVHGLGFLSGVWDAESGLTICAPRRTTMAQVMEISTTTLRAAPAGASAGRVLLPVYRAMFPCRKVSM